MFGWLSLASALASRANRSANFGSWLTFLARFIDRAHAALADEREDFELREKFRQFGDRRRRERRGSGRQGGIGRSALLEQAGWTKARQRACRQRGAALGTCISVWHGRIRLRCIHTPTSEANPRICYRKSAPDGRRNSKSQTPPPKEAPSFKHQARCVGN